MNNKPVRLAPFGPPPFFVALRLKMLAPTTPALSMLPAVRPGLARAVRPPAARAVRLAAAARVCSKPTRMRAKRGKN